MNPQSVSSARCTIVLVEDAMTFNITFFMFLIANIPMQTSPLTIHYFRKKNIYTMFKTQGGNAIIGTYENQ
jgi:hypothetical protein